MTSPTPSITPTTPLFRRYYAAWYDGSQQSADDVLAAVSNMVQYAWSISFFDQFQIQVKRCPPNLPTSPSCKTTATYIGSWFVVDTLSGETWSAPDPTFQAAFSTSAVIVGAGSPGGAPPVTSVSLQEENGAVALPALTLLNPSTSVTVPMSGTFASPAWVAKKRAVAGVTVLSSLTFAETARTTSSITYTVTTTGVATAAGLLLVDGYLLSVA